MSMVGTRRKGATVIEDLTPFWAFFSRSLYFEFSSMHCVRAVGVRYSDFHFAIGGVVLQADHLVSELHFAVARSWVRT